MWRYIVRRLLWVAVVVLIITLITFLIFFVMPPTDPAVAFAGKQPTPEAIAQVRQQFGLDKPVWVQYGLFFVSAPVFWLGLMALWLFWFKLGISAGTGYVSIATSFGSWLNHMILPWVVLALLFAAFYARMTRGNLIETMAQDYIRTARVKGLPEWKVIYKHGLRSSLTPVVTMFGMDLGTLFGGAVITETVFNLKGIGQWVVQSVFNSDLPVILAVTIVTSLAITLMNLLVDILYAYLDPRVRYT